MLESQPTITHGTSDRPPDGGRHRGSFALGALALGAFVFGTAELMVVGVLQLLADGLGVSISAAGQLVTAYALGICLGGPALTALTRHLGRRLLLCGALATFVVGNLLAAAAVGLEMLLVARVVTGALHGLFVGVASVTATRLVPPRQQGRAMSMVFGGIAASTVLGVPLGTLIGQAFNWQAAFVGVVLLGTLALVLTLVSVPDFAEPDPVSLRQEARAAFAPRVLLALAVGFVLMSGQFTALTYLAPFLDETTGVSGFAVSAFLLVYGLASAAGTFGGGYAADRRPGVALIAASALLTAILWAAYALGSSPSLMVPVLLLWGVVGFGLVPSFQLRVIGLAGAGRNLAGTLGASAVNGGIAAGAIVGAAVVDTSGTAAVFVAASLTCLLALPLAILSHRTGEVRA